MKKILTVLGTIFCCSVAGLVTLITLAYEDHEDVIHADYYERGLGYQKVMDGYDTSGRWQLGGDILTSSSLKRGETLFTINLEGEGIAERPTVTVIFERRASTVGRQVRQLTVSPKTGGFACAGSVNLPMPGTWEVMAVAELNGRKVLKRNFIEVL